MKAAYAIELSLFPKDMRQDYRCQVKAVDWAFKNVFNREPTVEESVYWDIVVRRIKFEYET